MAGASVHVFPGEVVTMSDRRQPQGATPTRDLGGINSRSGSGSGFSQSDRAPPPSTLPHGGRHSQLIAGDGPNATPRSRGRSARYAAPDIILLCCGCHTSRDRGNPGNGRPGVEVPLVQQPDRPSATFMGRRCSGQFRHWTWETGSSSVLESRGASCRLPRECAPRGAPLPAPGPGCKDEA